MSDMLQSKSQNSNLESGCVLINSLLKFKIFTKEEITLAPKHMKIMI